MGPQDILRFINGFYGYGNPAAPLWFVGYEERGDYPQRAARINQWMLQPVPFVDVHDYHAALGLMDHLGQEAAYQRTWGQLSRVALTALGAPAVSLDEVRAYQGVRLGRVEGDTLLTELFPLPNPGTKKWIWADQATPQVPYLVNRPIYEREVIASRVAGLQGLMQPKPNANAPAVVVAYGLKKYRDQLFGPEAWNPVLFEGFQYSYKNISYKNMGRSLVVSCVHPNHRGVTNQYFSEIGAFIRGSGAL